MAYGEGLRRNRCGIWCWRWVVPPDVRAALGATEVQRSLGTASRREATLLSLALRLAAGSLLEAARAGVVMDKDKLLATLEAARRKLREDDSKAELYEDFVEAHAARVAGLKALAQAQGEHQVQIVRLANDAIEKSRPQSGPPLSACMRAFCRHKQAAKAWEPKTKERWDFMLRLMVEAMGDRPINAYTSDDMTAFMEALLRYPANAKKYPTLQGLSFQELIEVNGYERLSEGTVSDHMGRISGFFKWAKNQPAYHLTHNPAEGKTIKKVQRIKRRPFSVAQLVALFSHKNFTSRTFQHPHHYWLMPLALLTGMRLNEACQLSLADFVKVDGVDVIRCADLEGDDEAEPGGDEGSAPMKRRKNVNATRRVPVHAELLRLGLVRWVERQREAGEVQLFPELKAGRDGHGQGPSKWFGRYRQACGIKGDRKYVFHCFRHAFISARMDHNIAEHRVAAVAGHETGLITGDTYWSDRDVVSLVDVVNAVGLPEAVQALIPPVEEVVFTGKPRRQPPSRLGARKTRERRVADAAARAGRRAASIKQ